MPFLINCIILLPILLGVTFLPSWPPAEVNLDSPPTSRSFSEVSLELRLKDLKVNGHADLCARKHRVVVSLSTTSSRTQLLMSTLRSLQTQRCPADQILVFVRDGVQQDANRSNAFAEVKEMDDVRVLQQDFGRGTHLLGALQVEKDPATWIITASDAQTYHRDMILSLVLAAQTLPDHVSPGFQCSEAVVQLHKLKSLPALVEGTVRGWCDSFAGVLYKRHFFDEAVFSYQEAPPACQDQPDVWFAGHLLNRGNVPYLISLSFAGQNVPVNDQSHHEAVRCGEWFGVFFDLDPTQRLQGGAHAVFREKDLEMLSYFHSQRGPGCFLELGPSDGANSISNFLEKDHGWRGILVEPSPSQRMTLERREGSLILNGGLAKKVCTRDWIEVYQNGGVQRGHFGFEDALDAGELALQEQTSNVVRTSVVSFPLKAVLDKVNLTRLNFVTLGPTSDPFDILSEFPFEEYQIDVLHIERKRLICRFLTRFLNPFRRWWWACDRVGADEAKLERVLSSAGYKLERTLLTEINGAEAVRRLENWPLPFYWTREVTVSLFFFRNPAVRDPPEEELKNVAEALSENKFLNERM